MLRRSYYQQAGNPLQAHLLPRYGLPFEFPPADESREQNVRAVRSLWGMLLFFDLVHSFFGFPFGRLLAPELPFIAGMILVALNLGARSGGLWTSVKVLLLTILAAVVLRLTGKPPLLSLMLLAILLCDFLNKFGQHWIHRCTLSPLPRDEAVQLRQRLQAGLRIFALTPVVAALAALVFDHFVWFPGTLLGISLLNVALTGRQADRLRYARAALRSWCAYNEDHRTAPGIFASPLGPASSRRNWLISTAGCFAVLYAYSGPSTMPGSGDLLPVIFLPACAFTLAPLGLLLPLLLDAVAIRQRITKTLLWSQLVTECQNSTNPVVRDSYYMGQVAADGSPLLVHRKTFDEHAHFLGTSGGGKTSKGLNPWIEQTIRRGDSSLIVIDLKADSLELLATMAAAAEALEVQTGQSLPLKVFSSMPDRPSHPFNPLAGPCWKNLDINQRTDMICAALGLNHGTDFGASYYSSAIAAVVYETLKAFPTVRSFSELFDRCRHILQPATKSDLDRETKKSGRHVYEELKRLAVFEQLNITGTQDGIDPRQDGPIDLASLFTEPQLLYVHLSSTLGASSAPTIARLFTYFLLTAAAQTARRNKVYLVIDEFQRMAAKSLDYLLQLARSMDIGVMLSNQSLEDLRTPKSNLIPAIEANCQYRQWFDVGATEDVERILKISGETVERLSSNSTSESADRVTVTASSREQIVPRLSVNEILTTGSDPDLSIVRIGRDAGYAQYGRFPFIVRSGFHISKDEYERRRGFPWPEQTPGMILPRQSQTDHRPGPTRPEIQREVDGQEDGRTSHGPGPLDTLFDALNDPSSKPRRSRKPKDDDQTPPEEAADAS